MQETVEQYRKRMFGFMEGRDPLKLQAAAPARLAKLLKGVSPAKARKRPAPDKWSISEIVAHIADTELVGGYRIRAILGQPGTPIIGFDQDEWVKALHYDKRDLKKFVRAVSRAARSQSRAVQVTDAGAVETCRVAQRTRRGKRRDDRADVLGPRHQPLRTDRTHPGEKEEERVGARIYGQTLRTAKDQSAVRRGTIPCPEAALSGRRVIGWSPNSAANRFGANHFRIRRASPGFGKHRHIRKCSIHAKRVQRMRIRLGQETRDLGPVVRRPMRREPEKEALIGGEAVDVRRRRFPGESLLKRRVRDYESAEIGDAFAFLELSVAVQTRLDFKSIELLRDAIAALAEILQVFRRPPIFQIAVGVKLRALIVEAVSHLVADHRADAAVIERVVSLGIEERRLENSRGKNNFVVQRRVIRVDGWRRHPPFGAVHGLADFRQDRGRVQTYRRE